MGRVESVESGKVRAVVGGAQLQFLGASATAVGIEAVIDREGTRIFEAKEF